MPDPCIQAPTIIKMDAKLDRVLESLQTLAAQKVQIDNLVTNQDDHHQWLKGHETRIQSLERTPGNVASRMLVFIGGIAATVISGLLIYGMTR